MTQHIKIAHIVYDEKFIDSAFEQFENANPGGNDYFFPSLFRRLKYIKNVPVKYVSPMAFRSLSFFRKLAHYHFVVLHSLNPFNRELVSFAPHDMKFVWIGMGYDYYDLLFQKNELYLEQTQILYEKYNEGFVQQERLLRRFFKKILLSGMPKNEVIKKIQYFSPVLPDEYSVLKEGLGFKLPDYVQWNYAITSRLLDDEDSSIVAGSDVLLGNSATFSNNHLEVLTLLDDLGVGKNHKIVCPLSYGVDAYADLVVKIGKELFGDNFVALRKFIAYEDYTKIVSGCSNVLMNHLRQQAGGNVLTMLHLGAKVFLNETNAWYQHLRNNGIKLFTLRDLKQNPDLLDAKLSEFDVSENRRILKSMFGSEASFQKTRALITTVSGSC